MEGVNKRERREELEGKRNEWSAREGEVEEREECRNKGGELREKNENEGIVEDRSREKRRGIEEQRADNVGIKKKKMNLEREE